MEASATFDQVEVAYAAMKQLSKPDKEGTLYYTGALTNLLEENGIPKTRYSQITSWLKRMGCIERIQRGAGQVPSIWILWKEPTRDDFENSKLYKQLNKSGYKVELPDLKMNEVVDRIINIEKRLENAGI